jgi:hypothetical protein
LSAGSDVPVQIKVTAPSWETTIVNRAAVSADQPDPNPVNNNTNQNTSVDNDSSEDTTYEDTT